MDKQEKIIILEKLSYLKEILIKLEIRYMKYKNEKDEEEKDTLFAAMSKYAEEIIEIGIKINNIFLEQNNDFAHSYYETFTKLLKYFKLDENFIKKLAKTTGFRNRITHEYEYINEEITLKSFENIIELYKKYIETINNLIK